MLRLYASLVLNVREVGDANAQVSPPSFAKIRYQPFPPASPCLRRALQHCAINERGQRDVDDGIQTKPCG
jgi:hypothetical protein